MVVTDLVSDKVAFFTPITEKWGLDPCNTTVSEYLTFHLEGVLRVRMVSLNVFKIISPHVFNMFQKIV